jgi:hypothetical protein
MSGSIQLSSCFGGFFYIRALKDASRSSRNGRHENANEQREDFAQLSNYPTQANIGF